MMKIYFQLLLLAVFSLQSLAWLQVTSHRARFLTNRHRLALTEGGAQTENSVNDSATEDFASSRSEDIAEKSSFEDEVVDSSAETNDALEVSSSATAPEPEDPEKKAIENKEKELKAQLAALEERLRRNRLELIKVREQVSESGKNGYFLVQAQVNDFLRKKDAELKHKVERNKKEFVDKMVPIVEMFRSAPSSVPGETEREQNMHKNFGSLLSSIVTIIEKYGYKDLIAEKETVAQSEVISNGASEKEDESVLQ